MVKCGAGIYWKYGTIHKFDLRFYYKIPNSELNKIIKTNVYTTLILEENITKYKFENMYKNLRIRKYGDNVEIDIPE